MVNIKDITIGRVYKLDGLSVEDSYPLFTETPPSNKLSDEMLIDGDEFMVLDVVNNEKRTCVRVITIGTEKIGWLIVEYRRPQIAKDNSTFIQALFNYQDCWFEVTS